MGNVTWFDSADLIERLTGGLRRRPQEVVFLLGAPLSAPVPPATVGVPGVDGMIDLIRQEFADDAAQLKALDENLAGAGTRRYQGAFLFLQGRRGPQAANSIVADAVRMARLPDALQAPRDRFSSEDDASRFLEADTDGWGLPAGLLNVGRLVSTYPTLFGRTVLTTNFDPLITIAIRRAGGQSFRTMLPSDGSLAQTEANGCHVVHLHGYWYGSDTLHTNRQLGQPRPRLHASLATLLRNKIVVVCGYGGWDDAFTKTLVEIVRDDAAFPEVLWTFHSAEPEMSDALYERLAPGIDRGRVLLYRGVDCNSLFGTVFQAWSATDEPKALLTPSQSNPVKVALVQAPVNQAVVAQSLVEGDDEDRPPVSEFFLGRASELHQLAKSTAVAVFITGIGGQGKSTLAAQYFEAAQQQGQFSLYVWRDCKEEGERFENQLASVIQYLSKGEIRDDQLASRSSEEIIEMVVELIGNTKVLFVFDNVDHYVDLETGRLTGAAGLFVTRILTGPTSAKAVFTCRPTLKYPSDLSASFPLAGIDLLSTVALFRARGAEPDRRELEEAHNLTNGHTFWLDLLAIQTAGKGTDGLHGILDEIKSGGTKILPDATIQSLWDGLKDRERQVLRIMAETVKPDTDVEIADYLKDSLNYQKVAKSLKALRALNLIVVKRRSPRVELLELHPMIRQFIRARFPAQERLGFIRSIISAYQQYRGSLRATLQARPRFAVLQRWTQNAELDLAAGRMSDAFSTLAEVTAPFESSPFAGEFCRVTRMVLASSDWQSHHQAYKGFENVFRAQVSLLSYLGGHGEVDRLLEQYELTVPGRDIRYVSYAEMRCLTKWLRGELRSAVEWGKRGSDLLTTSGVDSKSNIRHTLALAQRDAGAPEDALPTFLAGIPLSAVVDPDKMDENRGGPFYGNIGRCLHQMGMVDDALVCYQKSALLIEKRPDVINQGYIRAWVGELLLAKGERTTAESMFAGAASKWTHAFPARTVRMRELSRSLVAKGKLGSPADDAAAERACQDWIFGRS